MNANTKFVAPKGKFLVIGVDTFEHEDYPLGTFDSDVDAKELAQKRGGPMNKVYVYNDTGRVIYEAGTF